jgi:hypothetical protein
MAFPTVAATNTTNGTTATTTPVVNLPASIAAGETLLVLVRVASAGAIGWPAGWTELFDDASDGSDDQTACAWRKADGTEGSTITLSSASGRFAALSWRIAGAVDPTVQAPVFGTLVTGFSTLPDPGGVDLGAVAKDRLLLWLGGWEGEQTSPPTSNPTNYTTDIIGANSGTTGNVDTNCQVASASRTLTAASIHNAGSWTISASDEWTATVIAFDTDVLPTRFYGRESGSAPVSVAVDAGWENSASPFASKPMFLTSDGADTLTTVTGFTSTTGQDRCHRQWISEPMVAGIVFDTNVRWKGQFQVLESNADDNLTTRCGIRIVSEDGATVRHTVRAVSAAAVGEFLTALTNTTMLANSAGTGSYTTVANDRLVIEWGHGDASGTSISSNSRWGSAGTGDLPEEETSTATDLRPWFEVNIPVTFASAAVTGDLTKAVPIGRSAAGVVALAATATKAIAFGIVAASVLTLEGELHPAPKPLPIGITSTATVTNQGALTRALPIGRTTVGAAALTGTLTKALPISISAGSANAVIGTLTKALPITITAAGGVLAFPFVAASVASPAAPSTDAIVTLPSGIVAGETLLIWIRASLGGAFNWPAGWNVLTDSAPDGSLDQVALAWRLATGSEGSTVDLRPRAGSAISTFAAIAWRISGAADPTVNPPQFATLAVGTSTLPDPNALTPTGGAKNYLWLWLGGWEGIQTSPPASNPTNYSTDVIGVSSGTGTVVNHCRVASASRQLNAASEDPGSWTISASDQWTATVVAFHPPGGTTAPTGALEVDITVGISAAGTLGITGALTKTIVVGITANNLAAPSLPYTMLRRQRGFGWPVRVYGSTQTAPRRRAFLPSGFAPITPALSLPQPPKTATLTRAIPFGIAATNVIGVSGTLTKALPLGRSIVGSSPRVATVTRSLLFGRTIIGSGAPTATLSQQIVVGRSIAGAIELKGTLTKAVAFGRSTAGTLETHGTLTRAIPFGRTAVGAIAAGGTLTKAIPFGRSIAGVVANAGTLTKAIPFGRSAVGHVETRGALTKAIPFGRSATGTFPVSGSLTQELPIGTSIAGALEITGATTQPIPFAVVSFGTGPASALGAVTRAIPFGTSTAGAVALTGSLSRPIPVGRAIAGLSTLTGALTKALPIGSATAGALAIGGATTETILFGVSAQGATSTTGALTQTIQFGRSIAASTGITGDLTQSFTVGISAAGVAEISAVLVQPITFTISAAGTYPVTGTLDALILFGRIIEGTTPVGQQLGITYTDTSSNLYAFALGLDPVITETTMYLWTTEDQELEVTAARKNVLTGQPEPATGLTGITLHLSENRGGGAIGTLAWSAAERGTSGIYSAIADIATLALDLPEATYPDGTVVWLVLTKTGDVNARSWRKIVRRQREGDG